MHVGIRGIPADILQNNVPRFTNSRAHHQLREGRVYVPSGEIPISAVVANIPSGLIVANVMETFYTSQKPTFDLPCRTLNFWRGCVVIYSDERMELLTL
uniref:Uncharacterized protein n=1 Tax=Anopheles funestus TaxID=62324 RepID=A0A182RJ02_ANOFN